MLWSAKASKHLGLKSNVSFPGALAWPYLYPWPQRPPGLIEAAFDELAKRWRPIFDAFDEVGCNVAFELHPGEDLFDGATFEMFLERVGQPPALLHQLRPFALPAAAARLPGLHRHLPPAHQLASTSRMPSSGPTAVKGCIRATSPGSSAPGGSARWATGRSTFGAIFSKMAQYDFDGWAVLEWECCLKHPEQGAPRARPSSATTSSASPRRPSTTLPVAAATAAQLKRMLGL